MMQTITILIPHTHVFCAETQYVIIWYYYDAWNKTNTEVLKMNFKQVVDSLIQYKPLSKNYFISFFKSVWSNITKQKTFEHLIEIAVHTSWIQWTMRKQPLWPSQNSQSRTRAPQRWQWAQLVREKKAKSAAPPGDRRGTVDFPQYLPLL